MKIREIPKALRPREKALAYGLTCLSDHELLALLIRTGTKRKSAIDVAAEVLLKSNGLGGLPQMSAFDLMGIDGIKEAKSLEICAIMEMSRRIFRYKHKENISLENPKSLVKWLNSEIGFENQEHFIAVFLNHQLKILGHKLLFKGTVDKSLVHPRDLFREAVRFNASCMILVHNHPGKTMRASSADLETTKALVSAAQLLDLHILDHIIVSFGDFISLRQMHPEIFKES
ncbi:DNA repair protein RadC [Erysipelothrix urinaevulpis]|uniref:RadC family protein n=1 Tax=Erysipelothrix urinaevulpis TaxID=2683717 RepID=UPI00135C1C2E|nr:DNA repair protein RadC [Erysipelothrix urinaevulpis]